MDTVTEGRMAVALAQEGGIGIIHKNLSIDAQAEEVVRVKRTANGIIRHPAILTPDASVCAARDIMEEQNLSGVPIVTSTGLLKGIITRRDLRFLENWDQPVSAVMTKEPLVKATGSLTLAEAEKILIEKKVEKLLLVDENNHLTGLITIKDIDMLRRYPNSCKDDEGQLRVGAAVGVLDFERAERLIAQRVDILIVDSAHGHSRNVLETVKTIKKQWDIDVVAGNIATAEGGESAHRRRCRRHQGRDRTRFDLHHPCCFGGGDTADHGHSSCGTHGRDAESGRRRRRIRFSGDIVKAIAAGARVVMIGSLLAGFDESPGDIILYQGRSFKAYRGMGSLGAMMKGSSDRYSQKGRPPANWFPKGVEGRVPYRETESLRLPLIGGLRAGMELRYSFHRRTPRASQIHPDQPGQCRETIPASPSPQEAPNWCWGFHC